MQRRGKEEGRKIREGNKIIKNKIANENQNRGGDKRRKRKQKKLVNEEKEKREEKTNIANPKRRMKQTERK